MSLTSYRTAPPRDKKAPWEGKVGWRTWRRPTLPRLETQYHGRWGFSRPSSGWDRVRAPRHSHQVVQPTRRKIRVTVLVRAPLERAPLGVRLWMIAAHDGGIPTHACGGNPDDIEPIGRL